MTEDAAVAVLYNQFVADTGFVASLRRGNELDREAVATVLDALDSLGKEWSGRECIPKHAMFAMMSFDQALWPYRSRHSQAGRELAKADDAIEMKILDVVAPDDPELEMRLLSSDYPEDRDILNAAKSSDLTEADAVKVIQKHIAGGPGLVTGLRMGEGLNHEAVESVYAALGVLQGMWHDRECISKQLAVYLVTLRSAILASDGLYPGLEHEIAALAKGVAEQVMQCLA